MVSRLKQILNKNQVLEIEKDVKPEVFVPEKIEKRGGYRKNAGRPKTEFTVEQWQEINGLLTMACPPKEVERFFKKKYNVSRKKLEAVVKREKKKSLQDYYLEFLDDFRTSIRVEVHRGAFQKKDPRMVQMLAKAYVPEFNNNNVNVVIRKPKRLKVSEAKKK